MQPVLNDPVALLVSDDTPWCIINLIYHIQILNIE